MEEESYCKSQKGVDTGWAWVSLLAGCLGNFLVGFIGYSAGIFHIALLEEFHQGNAATAVVGSIFTCLLSLTGPFAGMFINATSCRVTMMLSGLVMTLGFTLGFVARSLSVVLVAYGLIAGVGTGFGYVPALVMVGFNFRKYRGIAVGVVSASSGCGMFASGPVIQYFLDKYGLNGTYLVMGAVSCQLIVLGALMRPSSSEIYHHHQRTLLKKETQIKCAALRQTVDIAILKRKSFMIILFGALLWHAGYSVVTVHLPNFSVVKGSNRDAAALLTLAIGLGSVFSRVLGGLASGPGSGLDSVLLMLGTLGITGLISLCFPLYSNNYWQQSIFAVLFGIYSGGLATFTVPLCIEMISLSKFSSALGFVYFVGGIGYFIGPTIAGLIVDETGNYEYCFYLSGVCFIVSSLFVLFASLWRPKDTDGKQTEDITEKLSFLGGSGYLTGSAHVLFESRELPLSRFSHDPELPNEDKLETIPLNFKDGKNIVKS